jgi:hypothetical protein
MKRFLAWSVIAFLVLVVASPVNAGYLIIRVLLEGGTSQGGAGNETGRPGQPPGRSGPMSGMRGPGDGPGRPNMPGAGGATTSTSTHADPSKSIVVVVPIEEDLSIKGPFYPKRNPNSETNPPWTPKLHTLFHGEKCITNLFSDGVTIQWYKELVQIPGPKKTRNSEVKALHFEWTKKKDPTSLMMALNAALAVGMIDEAVAYSDELLAYANDKPVSMPADVAVFTTAYAKMQKGIKGQQFSKPGKAEWARKLGAPYSPTKNHYTLIYWDATEAEVKRRFEVLEDNFKAFFIYHALRGIDLPVPETPLIAVLPKQGADVFNLAKALDVSTHLATDAFYSPEHDLLVLSPDALDDVRTTFARQNQQVYQMGVSRAQLLSGDGPRIKDPPKNMGGQAGQPGFNPGGQPGGNPDVNPGGRPGNFPGQPGANNQPPGKDGMKSEEVAHMQTIALIDTFSEDAAITCSISREASRQLLYATQQLPRYVELPEWLIHGAGDFYMRPHQPAFIKNSSGKEVMHIADATGYGVPNYVLQRYFRDLMEKNELNEDRGALLRNVLTDAYFHGLKSKEIHDPDPLKKETKGIEIGGGKQPAGNPNPMGRPGGGAQPPGTSPGPMPIGPRTQPGVPAPGVNAKEEEEDQTTIHRKKRERLSIKSQATAWALYYYLSKSQPEKFRAFLNELSAMPRDVPLEGAAVQAFYRVFNLDGSKESLNGFAREWLNYITHIAPAGIDIPLTEPKSASTTPSGPNP